MEPSQKHFSPFLKPLLDAPNSRYHIRDWDGSAAWQAKQYISEGLIGEDFGQSFSTTGQNDCLLIVANWGNNRKRSNTPTLQDINKLVNPLLDDIKFKLNLHAHGAVRILLWVNDYQKYPILPRTVVQRKSTSLQFEMFCHVEEIISGTEGVRWNGPQREDFLNLESGKRVAHRMQCDGVQIPFERQDEMQRKVQEHIEEEGIRKLGGEVNSQARSVKTQRTWYKELAEKEQQFLDGKFAKFKEEMTEPPKRRGRIEAHYTSEFLRLVELQRNFTYERKIQAEYDLLFEQQAIVDALELEACDMSLDAFQREKKLKAFTQQNEKLKSQTGKLLQKYREVYMFYKLDRKAFFQDPPLLMWDRRSAEPLMAHEKDFCGPTNLALLDIQPNAPNRFPMTRSQAHQFEYIMSSFFAYGTQTPDVYFDSLAPGALDAISSAVPALRDPLRGGYLDLSNFQARGLTPQLAYEIIMAWDRWEDKPSLPAIMTLARGDVGGTRMSVNR